MNIWRAAHAGGRLIRFQTRFHRLVPGQGAGSSRVTHPFATLLAAEAAFSFDLHA